MADVRQYETDVAIVGAGGAGMAAGIEARDAGAKVIAFEKAAEPGGAAKISGGGCLFPSCNAGSGQRHFCRGQKGPWC